MTTAQQAERARAERIRAVCPECGKTCRIAGAGSPAAGLFPQHRPEGARTGWCARGRTRARKAELVHGCKRCQALPTLPEGADTYDDRYRPAEPRPVKARGYCTSHLREIVAAERERDRDQRRAKNYGITRAEFDELVAAQGGGCACGRRHGATRRKGSPITSMATDHDHARQAECVAAGRHDADTCCRNCVRGAAGTQCNRDILDRFTAEQLESLAAYKRRPTAQRLGWWGDGTEDETETETMAGPKADAHCPDCGEVVDPRIPDQVAGCGQTPEDQS